MRASVIIPTYNGEHKILNALRALENQTLMPFEVIVVVDGSTDNTMQLLHDSSFNLLPLRVVEQENSGRARVRNRGAELATGDILVFLDDDMKPEPNWLEAHVQHHVEYPKSIMTGPQIDPYDSSRPDFQQFKAFVSRKWAEELSKVGKLPLSEDKLHITGANFSIPRNLFFEVGGFDNRLTDGEDFDLAVRANKLHVPIYYDKNAFAWHLEINSCAHFIKRNRCYYDAGKYLARIKPELYEKMFGNRTVYTPSLKDNLYKMFCHNFWIKSIDNDFWVWLPRKMRFKLYDIVGTANSVKHPEIVKL